MKRYITIDFLRGFAILAMIGLHVFLKSFDYSVFSDALQGHGSVGLIVGAILIVYFGSFAGLFVVVSAIAGIVSVHKQYEKLAGRDDAWKIVLRSQLLRGAFVMAMG